jgi:Holliday junction resolvase
LTAGSDEVEKEKTVYNTMWLQQVADEMAKKYTGGAVFEQIAVEILKRLGFVNISRGTRWDFDAEKDGKQYIIEVKGSGRGEDVVIRWHQLAALWEAYTNYGSEPLLLFVNSKGEWNIYAFYDGFIELPL